MVTAKFLRKSGKVVGWLTLAGACAFASSSCLAPGFKPRTDEGAADLGGQPGDGSGGAGPDGSGGTSASGGTTGSGGTGGTGGAASDPSVIGVLGEACVQGGAYACAGTDQRLQLRCDEGKWESFGECSTTERCDSRASNSGSCEAILTECLTLEPGDQVPSCHENSPQLCGVDRVTLADAAACTYGVGCLDGVCEPVVHECLGANEGDHVCSADGSESFVCGDNLVLADERSLCGRYCSGGVCADPPSCDGPVSMCGSAGDADCCESPLVPGGTFFRGVDTTLPATVSDFRLDKYEVTVGRFRQFVLAWDDGWRPAAGAGKHTHLSGGAGLVGSTGGNEAGWDTSWASLVSTTDTARNVASDFSTWAADGSNDGRQINWLNWYESYAFCIWDGGFLPSEAEWEYAAAGGPAPEGERTYPWGDIPALNPNLASYNCLGDGDSACHLDDLLDSGSLPGDGRFGQSELAGALAEWMLDDFEATVAVDCEDCVMTLGGNATTRGMRGGGWNSSGSLLAVAYRSWEQATARLAEAGTRCARSP